MTTSPPVEPLAGQVPRVRVVPPSVSSAGLEAVELAASAGLVLDPWQAAALDDALGERSDGTWSAYEVGLIAPRQNGKNAIVEARELAGLFLFGEQLIIHTAHEFPTAFEAFLRIRGLIEATPELLARVKAIRSANGAVAIELKSGARLKFAARTSGSGRGFSGDCVILDEAYRLPRAVLAAIVPTMSARPNPQLWYLTSSPPDVQESSDYIRDTRARAISDDPGRLAWLEWSCPAEVDPDDRDAWVSANPAYGGRLDVERVENERAVFTEEQFLVERLGVWLESGSSSKIPAAAWEAAFDPAAAVDPSDVVFALDMPPDRSVVSIAVSDGNVVELVAQVDPGDVGEWLRERVARWSPRAFVVDSAGPVSTLVPVLDSLDVQVVTTSARAFAEACGRFYDAVIGGTVRHRGQAPLTAAAASASTRTLGDSWAWARTSSTVDISSLVAASLAVSGALTIEGRSSERKRRPVFVY